MKKSHLSIFCLIMILSIPTQTQTKKPWQYPDFLPRWDVPYVPTPQEVVDAMLDMATVKSTDILYDLGCGDGRIVITAAKRFGTKGIGIDIDPERIAECHTNAATAKVEDLVMFLERDLFEADIREASVVTLYLLSSVNLKLRPKLFTDLKPGTRIVSHDFSMGDWSWDQKKELYANGKNHYVYFWILPANVTGSWKLYPPKYFSQKPNTLIIEQKFQKIQGKFHTDKSIITVEDAHMLGDQIEFMVRQQRKKETQLWFFTGKVKGHIMTGEVRLNPSAGKGNSSRSYKWRAERDPATRKPLETKSPNWDWKARPNYISR